jgi:hypothetical protein
MPYNNRNRYVVKCRRSGKYHIELAVGEAMVDRVHHV